MTEELERSLNEFLYNEPAMQTVPQYTQREKIKKRSRTHTEELAALQLKDPRVDEMSGKLDEELRAFCEEKAALEQRAAALAELQQKIEREEEKAGRARSIAEGIQAKQKEQHAALQAAQAAQDQNFEVQVKEREKSLQMEENEVVMRIRRRENAEELHRQLSEHHQKLFSEIDQVGAEKDAKLREKKTLFEEMREKLAEGLRGLDPEDAGEEAADAELEAARAFAAQHSADCQALMKTWEGLYGAESEKYLDTLNGFVERLQKLRPSIESGALDAKSKLWSGLQALCELAGRNTQLQASLQAEHKRQAAFTQLLSKLETQTNARNN